MSVFETLLCGHVLAVVKAFIDGLPKQVMKQPGQTRHAKRDGNGKKLHPHVEPRVTMVLVKETKVKVGDPYSVVVLEKALPAAQYLPVDVCAVAASEVAYPALAIVTCRQLNVVP